MWPVRDYIQMQRFKYNRCIYTRVYTSIVCMNILIFYTRIHKYMSHIERLKSPYNIQSQLPLSSSPFSSSLPRSKHRISLIYKSTWYQSSRDLIGCWWHQDKFRAPGMTSTSVQLTSACLYMCQRSKIQGLGRDYDQPSPLWIRVLWRRWYS